MLDERLPHEWSEEALLNKARRYSTTMFVHDREDWQFGFWSSFVLEMLLRAVFARISISLLADGKNWNNILYAAGRKPTESKYSPNSVATSELIKRAESVFPSITREMTNFLSVRMRMRNQDFHSGAIPFDDERLGVWLPFFFSVCKVLLNELELSLSDFFGDEISDEADTRIKALFDEAAKAVEETINAHKDIWRGKTGDEKTLLIEQAQIRMTRHSGHRDKCPACSCVAHVVGVAVGPTRVVVVEDGVEERQTMLPSTFECIACGLKISGHSKLIACNLGDSYTSMCTYDVVDFFNIDLEEEMRGMYEDDNNEY